MKKDGTWGDHVILHATAHCFKTCIRVVSSLLGHHDLTICQHHDVESSSNSSLLVLGHVHEHHYVSLRPKPGKVGSPLQSKVCKLVLGNARCISEFIIYNFFLSFFLSSLFIIL